MNRPIQRILLLSGLLLIVVVLVGLVFYSNNALQFASGTLETKSIPHTAIGLDIERYSDAQVSSLLDAVKAQNSTILITNISRVTSTTCENPQFQTFDGYPLKVTTLLTLAKSKSLQNHIGLISNISSDCLATSSVYSQKLATQTAVILTQAIEQGFVYSSAFSGFVIPFHPNLYTTDNTEITTTLSYYLQTINFPEIKKNSIKVYGFIDLSRFSISIPKEDQIKRLKEFQNETGLSGFIFNKSEIITQEFKELLNKEFSTSVFLVE